MDMVRPRARFDWLVEIGGASSLGLGGAYAALKLAPSFAIPSQAATIVAGFTFFAVGMLVMRTAPSRPAEHTLADFAMVPVEHYGIEIAENQVHVHDFHATILHLLGLDHEKLTYRHGGRDFRLTDVSGNIVRGVLT